MMKTPELRATTTSSSSSPQQPGGGPNLFVAVVFLALIILYVIRRRKAAGNNKKGKKYAGKSLDSIPGPRQYFLGNWLNLFQMLDYRNTLPAFTKWCVETPGHLMSLHIGPFKGFILLSAEAIQKTFGSGDLRCAQKSFLYRNMKMVPWFDGVLISNGEKWKSRRKLVASKLNYGSLLNYIEPMNETSRWLVSALEERFNGSGNNNNNKPAEIHDLLFDFSFRTIARTLFGIESEEEYLRYECDGFVHGTHKYLEMVMLRISRPWIWPDFLYRLHPISKGMDEYYAVSRKLIDHAAKEIVEARRAGIVKKPSLVKDLVEAGLDPDAIYEEVQTTFMAGYDTTGHTLHYLFFFLALNPVHQELCREEVDKLFENPDLCPDGEVGVHGLKNLPYLEQCILETLRLLPPVFGLVREIGVSVTLDDGTVIPAGTSVALVNYSLHRNPEYYPNPELFDPSRFSLEERKKRSQFAYVPFSIGPRVCVGLKFAMNGMLITAARVLRHFQVETTDRLEDLVILPKMSLTPETNMTFRFTKRAMPVK